MASDSKYGSTGDLLACCSGIGASYDCQFRRGEECLECLHDIQRYLRHDDPDTQLYHRKLGEWNIVRTKLLPLALLYKDQIDTVKGRKTLFTVTKLLVMLTMPLDTDMPDDADKCAWAAQIRQQQRHAAINKADFLREGVILTFTSLLQEPLSHMGRKRTEKDNITIELVLTLFRNLLVAGDPSAHTKLGDADAADRLRQLHEDMVLALHHEYVVQIILMLTEDIESSTNKDWNLLMLELFHLLFKDHARRAVKKYVVFDMSFVHSLSV